MTVPPVITILKPELERETLKEPPKRWRNWYRARFACGEVEDSGRVIRRKPGEVFSGDRLWPSREVAQTVGFESEAEDRARVGVVVCVYLGAFPDGETP